jgi:hypothetical protein
MSTKSDINSCCDKKPAAVAKPLSCCDRGQADTPGPQSSSATSDPMPVCPGPALSSRCSSAYWVTGFLNSASGKVPKVDTSLEFRDMLGAWGARWGINRMNYRVSPGLYGVGDPDNSSPVLVTANYKMSFDRLRRELTGLNAWIMVLDTKGINVWCAAGKGTFGTAELVRRIAMVGLSQVVSHRTVILPQLGAPGVAAHEVRRQSGFKVVYGPVSARDIKAFLKADMHATREMRSVSFGFLERLFLTPIEVVGILKPLAIIAAALSIAHVAGLITVSFSGLLPFIGAVLIGAVISPALLPWIPGRAFSWKGWLMGLLWAIVVLNGNGAFSQPHGLSHGLGLLLLLPAVSAFLALNFTGASTYTSLSGVKKEMRFALPAIIVSASAGTGLWVVGLLL